MSPASLARAIAREATSAGHRIDVERVRHREILQQRGRVEQHRARTDDAELIQ